MKGPRNFFVVNRRLLEHPIWKTEKFTRGQAWVDMFGLANHAPGYIRSKGARIDLDRGDLGWSKSELASRWRWTREKVKRFFKELEADGMISVITTHPSTVVRICNYMTYQLNGATHDTLNDPAIDSMDHTLVDPTDDSLTRTTRRKNNNKKEERKGTLDDFKKFASEIGATDDDAESLYYYLESTGWKVGNAAVQDWRALMRSRKASGWLPSCKQSDSKKSENMTDVLNKQFGHSPSEPPKHAYDPKYDDEHYEDGGYIGPIIDGFHSEEERKILERIHSKRGLQFDAYGRKVWDNTTKPKITGDDDAEGAPSD